MPVKNAQALACFKVYVFYGMWFSSKFRFAKNLEAQRRKIDSPSLWQ